jgi:Uma2 family endonuclease
MVATTRLATPVMPTKHCFTVEEYYKMAEVGILGMESRTELIAGEIIEMSPIGAKHAGTINRLNRIISPLVWDQAIVSIQNSVRLNDRSQPQPDLAILEFRDDCYTDSIPIPTDIFLLIEVSDSTLKYDRETKLPLYDSAAIPEVWIVDIEAQVVEVYRSPNGDGYQEVQNYGKGEAIVLFSVAIAVDQIF